MNIINEFVFSKKMLAFKAKCNNCQKVDTPFIKGTIYPFQSADLAVSLFFCSQKCLDTFCNHPLIDEFMIEILRELQKRFFKEFGHLPQFEFKVAYRIYVDYGSIKTN